MAAKELTGNGFRVSVQVSGCGECIDENGSLPQALGTTDSPTFKELSLDNGADAAVKCEAISNGLPTMMVKSSTGTDAGLVAKDLQAGKVSAANGPCLVNNGVGSPYGGGFYWSDVGVFPYTSTGALIDEFHNAAALRQTDTHQLSVDDGNGGICDLKVVGMFSSRRKVITLADEATSFNASQCNTITLGTSGVAPVNPTIDDITDGIDNQRITILPADALFSIVSSPTIKLKSSPWLSSDDKSISLIFDGSVWWED